MTRTECRSCGDTTPCQDFTLHVRDVVIHDEGVSDVDAEQLTGQCDDCLTAYGADDHCDQPEVQDEAEARAEREYRTLDRGEL